MRFLLANLALIACVSGVASAQTPQANPQDPHVMVGPKGQVMPTAPPNAAATVADFARKAASSGMAEVENGQMALRKAHDPRIKDLAQHMIDDHGKANGELKKLAFAHNIDLPGKPVAADMHAEHKLATKAGADFDKAYLDDQRIAHQQAIALFQAQADDVHNAPSDVAFKDFAAKTLPVLQQHAQMIDQLSESLTGMK